MKIVKFILLPLLVVILAFYIAGFFAPEGWDVEVSTEINASPEAIHPWISDLRRWEEWIAMGQADSAFEFSYAGEESGVGAVAKSVGPGSNVRWEITASDPQKGVWFDEILEENIPAKGAIMLEAHGATTKVTWVDRGSLGDGPFLRLFHPLMQSSLAKGFTDNLASLKSKIESQDGE
ncbi:MAG: hypothetical protein ACI8X5_003338 [Planctomycetota bacterium]|jgi:hypothetical protein